MKQVHNRNIMAQMLKDGQISDADYKKYLKEQEEREKHSSEKFQNFVKSLEEGEQQ